MAHGALVAASVNQDPQGTPACCGCHSSALTEGSDHREGRLVPRSGSRPGVLAAQDCGEIAGDSGLPAQMACSETLRG